MAFKRARRAPTPETIEATRLRLASEDRDAYEVAEAAVNDWAMRFPVILMGVTQSTDGGRLLIEGFVAARVVRACIVAGKVDPVGIFNEQQIIADRQAAEGQDPDLCLALLQIRCMAIGYMFQVLDRPDECKAIGHLFNKLFPLDA